MFADLTGSFGVFRLGGHVAYGADGGESWPFSQWLTTRNRVNLSVAVYARDRVFARRVISSRISSLVTHEGNS